MAHWGSKIAKKRTFYSGQLVLRVYLIEGHHEDPMARERQVKGCPHNSVYRVEFKPLKASRRGELETAVEWVCPPASLSESLDSVKGMKGAAHAALSFADDDGWPVEEYAAFGDPGWHLGVTPGTAWPKE